MRRPTSTISARSCCSVPVVTVSPLVAAARPPRCGSPFPPARLLFELPPTLLQTEIVRSAPGGQRQFLPRGDEGPAHRIANELHRRPDFALAPFLAASSTFDDSVDHAP